MQARDILRDFMNSGAMPPMDDEPIREGIVSDVFGTLIKHGELDVRYYKFLLWAQEQGVPVTIASTEPMRARREMQNLGCADTLVDTIEDKMRIYSGMDSLEAVIDDDIVFTPALIVINPNSREFQKFLATSQYRNHGRSHPADLPRPPCP